MTASPWSGVGRPACCLDCGGMADSSPSLNGFIARSGLFDDFVCGCALRVTIREADHVR